MLEPKQNQSKYMNLNEFLDLYYRMQSDSKFNNDIYYVMQLVNLPNTYNRIVNNRISDTASIEGIANNIEITTKEGQELATQLLQALRDPDYQASDFLNMVNLLTALDRHNIHVYEQNKAIQTQLFLINNGKIKNLDITYQMLRKMNNFEQYPNKMDVKHALAIHKHAKPNDIYDYAQFIANTRNSELYADAPEELLSMLNDQITKVDKKIDVELSKDFPNEETIRKLYPGNLINIAIIIKDIIESQVRTGKRSQDDLNQIQELVKVLNEKYNMTNILKFEQGNYIQQYDERMEFRVAEQEAQLEQQSSELSHTKHELEISKKHGRETSERLDEQTDEIRKLKEKIAKLESELGTEKSKNAVLNATIRTFISESEKRATGSVLNKGKDLAAQIAQLKRNLEKQ